MDEQQDSSPALSELAHVESELRRIFFGGAAAHFAFGAATTALVGGYFILERPDLVAGLWVVTAGLVQALLAAAAKLKESSPGRPARPFDTEAGAMAALYSAIFALGPWLLYQDGSHLHNAVLAVWLQCTLASAAPALVASKRAVLTVCLVVGSSFAIRMGTEDNPVYTGHPAGKLIATSFFLFAISYFIFFSLRTNRVLLAGLKLAISNELLAQRLKEEVGRTVQQGRQKSRFLASATHDLRQPLQALILLSDALVVKFRGTHEAADVERLNDAVSSLATSLDSMLRISRLDSGAVAANMQTVELRPLFEELRSKYSRLAAQLGVRLRFSARRQWVIADPDLLQELVDLLVDNAIRHGAGAAVLVCARRDARGGVRIEVRDAGPGIDPVHHDNIFLEFFQIANAGRDRKNGLGVGLAIAKRLAALQQIRVQVRSRPGHGSTFALQCTSGATSQRSAGAADTAGHSRFAGRWYGGEGGGAAMANPRRDEVRRSLAAEFYSTVRQQFVGIFVTTCVWGGLLCVYERSAVAYSWLVGALAVQVFRLWMNMKWQPANDKPTQHWERQAMLTCTVSAVVYAAAPWMFPLPVTLPVLTVWMLGTILAAAPALAALRNVMIVYCSVIGLSFAARVLAVHDEANTALALGSVLATGFLIYGGVKAHRQQVAALELGIRNRVLTEGLRHQVDAVRTATFERSRFLAAASHDLRQPLHVVSLLAEALRNKFAASPDAGDFESMLESVHALNASLHAMLDVSRLEAGVVVANVRPIALTEVFSRVRQAFFGVAEEKGLNLRFRSTGYWIEADPQLAERLFSNLVSNAVKYTPEGSVHVSARRRGGHVLVEVRDSGSGIPRELQSRIFDEFFRAEPMRGSGLGIGLAVVKRLAQMQGFTVDLRSDKGCGTTVSVLCAAANPVPQQDAGVTTVPPGAAGGSRALAGLTILVLDNEAAIHVAVRELLGPFGVTVDGAETAEAAIALAGDNAYDVMLIDHRLGGARSGLEVLPELWRVSGRKVPAVVVTGETDPAVVSSLESSGVQVCFKPLGGAALLSILQGALSGAGPAPQADAAAPESGGAA